MGLLLTWLIGLPWIWLCVFLHESAHFTSGRLLGMEPFALVVGRGPALFHRRVRGVLVSLHPWPSHGMVFTPARDPGQPVWRHVLYLAAGLVSDSVMLTLLVLFILHGGTSGELHSALVGVAAFHAFYIVSNLLPMEVKLGVLPQANDGKAIWLYLKGGSVYATQRYRDLYATNVRRYDPAFDSTRAWINDAPEDLLAQYHQGMRAIETHDMETAPLRMAPVLRSGHLSAGEEAAILDGLACIALYERKAGHLGQALEWIRRARARLPECATLRGTNGALLVEDGAVIAQSTLPDAKARARVRVEEGLALLLPLAEEGQALIDRAVSMQYIARAHEVLGDVIEAKLWKRRLAVLARGPGAVPPMADQRVGIIGRLGALFIALICGLGVALGLNAWMRHWMDNLTILPVMLLLLYPALLTGYIGLFGRTPGSMLPWRWRLGRQESA